MSENRMTPERRWWIENMCSSKEMREVLNELDAVTRERDELRASGRIAIDAGEVLIATLTRERDEARKDSARLDWLLAHLSDPWPIAHSTWDRGRDGIDESMGAKCGRSLTHDDAVTCRLAPGHPPPCYADGISA